MGTLLPRFPAGVDFHRKRQRTQSGGQGGRAHLHVERIRGSFLADGNGTLPRPQVDGVETGRHASPVSENKDGRGEIGGLSVYPI